MEIQYPDRESIKKGIKMEVRAYIDAITILGSLKSYLEQSDIECYIEKKIDKIEQGYKRPDLLIHSKNYIVVDHKYTESTSEKNLSSRVSEMDGYKTTFILNLVEFIPEVVMLIPESSTESFKKIGRCPITWDYSLNSEITIKQSIGAIKDTKIASLFKPLFICPRGIELSKYKFILSHSPLPYMACQVYTILWTLQSASDWLKPEFTVDYDHILSQFNYLFPPWISSEVKQLYPTRLKQSLMFLQIIDWVKWVEPENKVIIYRNKGKLQGDILEYFIDQFTDQEYMRKMKEYEIKMEEYQRIKHPKLEHFWKKDKTNS